MQFFTEPLYSNEMFLKLNEAYEGDTEKGWSPGYRFGIFLLPGGEHIGNCAFRIGYSKGLYYGGNIGYEIFEPYRGHNYAAKACLLLFELAKKHEMEYLYITCTPDNIPSRKICERVGGVLEAIVDLPEDNELYLRGDRQECVCRVDL